MSTVQRVQRSFAAHHLYVMLVQGCAAFALDRINDVDIKRNKIWTPATNRVKACQCHRSYLKASSCFSVHVAEGRWRRDCVICDRQRDVSRISKKL